MPGWAWLKLSDQENHLGTGRRSVVAMRFGAGRAGVVVTPPGSTQGWVVFIISSFSPMLRSLIVCSVSPIEALRKT